jgi:hypothetical protein
MAFIYKLGSIELAGVHYMHVYLARRPRDRIGVQSKVPLEADWTPRGT